ncbi:hypothetical protein OCOJLMKI_1551 [Methylobacterium iners]|uniref:Uncharacterized protein n=1 Tax=Methylobacterium iners TaxID=418707 RepID=A0ABQ4RXB8_9HYPH|nr:hypothetical protein OCOJLMKI_1551 [Methylobacterium iners]
MAQRLLAKRLRLLGCEPLQLAQGLGLGLREALGIQRALAALVQDRVRRPGVAHGRRSRIRDGAGLPRLRRDRGRAAGLADQHAGARSLQVDAALAERAGETIEARPVVEDVIRPTLDC